MKHELAQDAAKGAPPVVVAASAWFFGLTLNDWVAIGTLLYLFLQGSYLIWKWVRDVRRSRK